MSAPMSRSVPTNCWLPFKVATWRAEQPEGGSKEAETIDKRGKNVTINYRVLETVGTFMRGGSVTGVWDERVRESCSMGINAES